MKLGVLKKLVLLVGLIPSAAFSQDVDFTVDIITNARMGIFCDPGYPETHAAPDGDLISPTILLGIPDFISHSKNVPAIIGVGFGVTFSTKNTYIPNARFVLNHPPMGVDATTQQISTDHITPFIDDIMLFTFDHDYELLEGLWTFEAFDGDRLLFKQNFNVVSAESMPELAEACGYEDLLSYFDTHKKSYLSAL